MAFWNMSLFGVWASVVLGCCTLAYSDSRDRATEGMLTHESAEEPQGTGKALAPAGNQIAD